MSPSPDYTLSGQIVYPVIMIGINIAGKPEDDEKFANLKAEKFWLLNGAKPSGDTSVDYSVFF